MNKAVFLTLAVLLGVCSANRAYSQDTTVVLSRDMFDHEQVILLSESDGWVYHQGNDPSWADPDLDTSDWEVMKPSDLTIAHAGESGIFEGWFRLRFKIDSTLAEMPLGWRSGTFGAMDLYLDGVRVQTYGNPDPDPGHHQSYNPYNQIPDPADLEAGREYVMAFYLVDHHSSLVSRYTLREARLDPWLRLTGPEYTEFIRSITNALINFQVLWITALFLLTFLFWVISFQSAGEYLLRLIAWVNTLFLISAIANYSNTFQAANLIHMELSQLIFLLSVHMIIGMVPMVMSQMLKGEISRWLKWLFWIFLLVGMISHQTEQIVLTILGLLFVIGICMVYVRKARNRILTSQWMVIGGLILTVFWMLTFLLQDLVFGSPHFLVMYSFITAIYLTLPMSLILFISLRYREILIETQNSAREVVQLTNEKLAAEREKQIIAANQQKILEQEVETRTKELRESLENLKATQEQLVQQEKLASLGQLTAGIAHEIKNPLNFVNNFSDVSLEMIDEALEEIRQIGGNKHAAETVAKHAAETVAKHAAETADILADIKSNLKKIHEHGTRADSIVKSMLQHSRGGDGKPEPVNLNALIKEYVNLSFHGMRAGKDPINVDIDLQLDESIGEVPLIAEDFSRVVLNLCNNAFDAMREWEAVHKHEVRSQVPDIVKAKPSAKLTGDGEPETGDTYHPKLTVRTKSDGNAIIIEIEDNGPGIPNDIKDNILQPFFTTKKGTQGTGLGLSITNDIVKAHGGELSIDSTPGTGVLFKISLRQK